MSNLAGASHPSQPMRLLNLNRSLKFESLTGWEGWLAPASFAKLNSRSLKLNPVEAFEDVAAGETQNHGAAMRASRW